jgi:hypothetical protein
VPQFAAKQSEVFRMVLLHAPANVYTMHVPVQLHELTWALVEPAQGDHELAPTGRTACLRQTVRLQVRAIDGTRSTQREQ